MLYKYLTLLRKIYLTAKTGVALMAGMGMDENFVVKNSIGFKKYGDR